MSTRPLEHDPYNTQFPNAARVYDYSLGGSHNYEADRQAAEYMFSLVPSTKKWVRMLRASLQESAHQMWDAGITHFVDFASGLPASDHIHEVLPVEAKIVYSDRDPVTVSAASKMLEDYPNAIYLRGDVRDATQILESDEAKAFLGDTKKLGIILNGVTVFLTPEEIEKVFQELYDWVAPGSKLYITYETKEKDKMTDKMQTFLDMFAQMKEPFYLYNLEECIAMSKPWKVAGEGLVPVSEFLGLPEDYVSEEDHEGVGLEFYAAILEKPE